MAKTRTAIRSVMSIGFCDSYVRPQEVIMNISELATRYSLTIQWSDEDQVYVVSLPEWGDTIHTHGTTRAEAFQNGMELLEGLIISRQQRGEPLPEPKVYAA